MGPKLPNIGVKKTIFHSLPPPSPFPPWLVQKHKHFFETQLRVLIMARFS